MKREKLLALIGSVCLILVLATLPLACAPEAPPAPPPPPPEEEAPPTPPAKWPEHISFVSGAAGGGWHAMAGAMSDLITRYVEGVTCTGETGGGSKNLMLLNEKQAELAFAVQGTAYRAMTGIQEFEETGTIQVRTLWGHYPLYYLGVMRAGKDLENPANWKGKVLYADEPAVPALKQNLLALLDYYGLSEKDVTVRQYTKPAEASAAIKEGTGDVWFTPCGVGYPPFVELFQTTDCSAYKLTADAVNYWIKTRYEVEYCGVGYFPVCLRGQTEPYLTTQRLTTVICRADMDDDLAYAITKAIWDHRDILYVTRAEFDTYYRNYDLAVSKQSTAPYHSGAIRYWKEVGAWTPEMDKWQKEKLAEFGG